MKYLLLLFIANTLLFSQDAFPIDIRLQLHRSINQQKVLSYKKARSYLFGKLHLRKDSRGYYVKDVYCHQEVGEIHDVGPMRIPDHRVINCEHTWPQKRFNPSANKKAQLSDLHHLFPTDSRANSSRGHHPFAEVNGRDVHEKCSVSQRGISVAAFEPPLEHRGNVARALFYFSIRYKIHIANHEEFFLRKWHEEDPVDYEEMRRNAQIQVIQGNRNPFIDKPEIVREISDF